MWQTTQRESTAIDDGALICTKLLAVRTWELGELGGFGLRRHRYVVIVSEHRLVMP